MITIRQKGNFKKIDSYLTKSLKISKMSGAEEIIYKCIEKLKQVTPVETGLTAESWNYTIEKKQKTTLITINNTNIQNGVNIALILEYGHGTQNGTWIEGKNYIAPVVFDAYQEILNEAWEGVKKL